MWWIAVPVVAVVVLLVVPWLLATAHRLDRLHVRTDAAWAALDAALARRAVVSRAVAAVGQVGSAGEDLRSIADAAERAPRQEREAAENLLTRRLAGLERGRLTTAMAGELADAEHRVVLARRVHNDAVRDTLALRRRRVVRWLKIAGTAPMPAYFEIAEPEVTVHRRPAVPRRAARVVLLDPDRRVLLLRGSDVTEPDRCVWYAAGGGVDIGEQLRETAVREVRDATGIKLDPATLTGPVWRRSRRYERDGQPAVADEWYFLAELRPPGGDGSGGHALDGIPPAGIGSAGYRWWAIGELRRTGEVVQPAQLPELLPGLLADGWDGTLRQVQ